MGGRDGLRKKRSSTAPRAALNRAESPFSQLRSPRATLRGAVTRPQSQSRAESSQGARRGGLVTPVSNARVQVKRSVPPPTQRRRLTIEIDLGEDDLTASPTSKLPNSSAGFITAQNKLKQVI